MACRLVNLHTQPLRIDLRGGTVLVLAPGDRSAALRDEWLYDNHHLVDWERAGWVRRVGAQLADVAATPASTAAQGPALVAPPAAAEKHPPALAVAARRKRAASPSLTARKRASEP